MKNFNSRKPIHRHDQAKGNTIVFQADAYRPTLSEWYEIESEILRNKQFENTDIADYWLGQRPEFECEESVVDYDLEIYWVEREFFEEIVGAELETSLSKTQELINCNPTKSRIVAILLFEKLKRERSFLKKSDNYKHNYYIGVSNQHALMRLKSLIVIIKKDLKPSWYHSNQAQTTSTQKTSPKLSAKKKIQIKDILMFAKIPIILYGIRFSKDFSKDDYFEWFGRLYGVEIPKQPEANICVSASWGHYHQSIKDFQELLNRYAEEYNKYKLARRNGKSPGHIDQLKLIIKDLDLS